MESLKVTSVVVQILKVPYGKIRGFARITLNDKLNLTSLRIYDGVKGPFVSYPLDVNCKGEDNGQIFYPVTKELRDHIENAVLEKYREEFEIED